MIPRSDRFVNAFENGLISNGLAKKKKREREKKKEKEGKKWRLKIESEITLIGLFKIVNRNDLDA